MTTASLVSTTLTNASERPAAPDIFNGRLGRGYATALVGKTVEVQGLVAGALCDPRAKATIQVTMSNQLRIY